MARPEKTPANPDSATEESSSDSEFDHDHESPVTAPQTLRTPRPSELKTLQCPYNDCLKSFNRRARLAEHLRSHTNSRPFKCNHDGCTKDFLRDSHLKHHIKSAHTNVRDYICSWDGCGKSFATGTRLRRHEAAHQGREKWKCRGYDGCDETFRKHDTLRKHVLTVHENKKPFPCTETDSRTGENCKSAFETPEKLRAHQRTKHDSSRFTCTLCLEHPTHDNAGLHAPQDDSTNMMFVPQSREAFFTTYADLQNHIATVHPPICTQCSSTFTTPRELTRHLELIHNITHAGEAQDTNSESKITFSCTYPDCPRTFTKRATSTSTPKPCMNAAGTLCAARLFSPSQNWPVNLKGAQKSRDVDEILRVRALLKSMYEQHTWAWAVKG